MLGGGEEMVPEQRGTVRFLEESLVLHLAV